MADEYCTLAELKASIDLTDADGDDTVLLDAIREAASRAIDSFTNRPDGFIADALATARYYPGSDEPWQRIDECVAIAEVAVKDSITDTSYVAWDSPTTNMANDGDWLAYAGGHMQPDFNILAKLKPYTALMVDPTGDEVVFTGSRWSTTPGFTPDRLVGRRKIATVRVTANWGYAVAVPPQIKQASIIQGARWYKRGQSGWSTALASGELGQLLYEKKLDPDVEMILVMGGFIKPIIGVI